MHASTQKPSTAIRAGTGRRRTRAVLAAGGAAALFLAVSAPSAVAAPPVTTAGEYLEVVCEGSGAGGPARLGVEVLGEGTQTTLALHDAGGRPLDSQGPGGTVVRNGYGFTGSVAVYDADGLPAGTATFDLVAAASGPAETTSGTEQAGNVRQRTTEVRQPLSGTATVALDGSPVATLSDCAGLAYAWTKRTTQPDAATGGATILNVDCLALLPGGGMATVWVEGGLHTLASVQVRTDQYTLAGDSHEARMSHNRFSSSVPLTTAAEEPAGTAQLDLRMERTGRYRFVELHSVGRERFTIEELRATGTLEMPDGSSIALDCIGDRTIAHEVATSPKGPGSTGPAPANDGPAGAVVLAPGDRHNAQTRAAVKGPEVPLWCYDPPEDPGFLSGHTVWYRFTGTGAPMTVDTAGSNLNTILAVYAVDGDGALIEVACADDHFRDSFQARATVLTEAGAEYLVQVGGIGAQSGLVRIALD